MNSEPTGVIHISAYAASDAGRQRSANQDQWLILDLTTGARGLLAEALEHDLGPQGTLLVVSDGLGGAAGGELASSLAVESLLRDLKGQVESNDVLGRYYRAIQHANRWIWEVAQTDVELHGMGATLTTALIYRGRAYVAQVGDSRGYLIRGAKIYQITEDQSLLGALVTRGELSPEQARVAYGRNVVLQALGPQVNIQIAITEVALQDGDLLVLCTDGLFNQVPAEKICHAFNESPDLKAACEELIRQANDSGGPDNTTIVAARVTGPGLSRAGSSREPTESLHRMTTFDASEILKQHPDLTELATAKVKRDRARFYLLLFLTFAFMVLFILLAWLQ
jgi:protein phosphatase